MTWTLSSGTEMMREMFWMKIYQILMSGGLPDKKVISETLREASKRRLSTALNNAQERLGELPAIDAAASFLETECFEKYEKVGKTFYNSQVAATIRWLSSSTHGQINDRLNTNPPLASTTSSEDCHSNMISSPQPLSAYCESTEPDTNEERTHDSIQSSHPCNLLQVEIPKEKIELPPILSFSEFAKKSMKAAVGVHSNSSSGVQKRVMESGKHGRSDLEKKMKLR